MSEGVRDCKKFGNHCFRTTEEALRFIPCNGPVLANTDQNPQQYCHLLTWSSVSVSVSSSYLVLCVCVCAIFLLGPLCLCHLLTWPSRLCVCVCMCVAV